MKTARTTRRWLHDFRRSMRYLRPHRGRLVAGLLMAIGVSVFYTFSFSSVIPMLKVIFTRDETLADWIARVEAQRRTGTTLMITTDGVLVERVFDDSPNATTLTPGTKLINTEMGASRPAMGASRPRLSKRSAGMGASRPRLATRSTGMGASRPRLATPSTGMGDSRPRLSMLIRHLATTPEPTLPAVRVRLNDGSETTRTLHLRPRRIWLTWLIAAAQHLPGGRDPDSRMLTLAAVMGALVLIALLGAIFRVLNEGLVAAAVQRAMHDLRSDLARHVLHLPMHWHLTQPPGDVLARFANDVGKVEVGLMTLFGKVVREPLKAAGVFALTVAIDWRLLVVAVLGLPVGMIAIRTFGRAVRRSQKRASQSWGRLLEHLGEKLAGIRIVKAYSAEDRESDRFEHEDRRLTRAQTHIELIDAATKPVLETLAFVAVAAFVLYGGQRVFAGRLEPHLFLAAVVCLGGIFDPLRKMGNVNNRLNAAEASARRLFELLDRPVESHDDAALPALPRLRRELRFEHVSFAYPSRPDVPVLRDISFRVPHGQVVAIVGPNGSGKTTLMSLLMRFFEPATGRILLDDHDIARYSVRSLRDQIGLVTQEVVIFSGTVRENIAYGDENPDEDAVRRAARLAHVDEFVRTLHGSHDGHPAEGYDALITARNLSGGQRQRIALARAIYRDPPILILDEATSQIDSESERKIAEALEDVTRGRTTFIIAHRLSTIRRADRILVLEAGRLVGDGTHAELSRVCPAYAALYRTQFATA